MADLYPNQSPTNSYHPQSSYHHRPQDSQPQQPYHLPSPAVVYPPRLLSSSHSSPDDTANHKSPPKSDSAAHSPQLQQQHHSQQHPQAQQPPQQQQQSQQSQQSQQQQQQQNNMTKTDTKPQATFLTKLYALLERPENHHMIRWDPAGEHIIVERPEQLALHVLPSIYRQSRFASFSRQLNIYGFMRKVNLRNVDPAIDDPDASTWSHPTLNRHSPPEVVANFKRRVPPRLPKPRKRPDADQHPAIPPPRSASGLGTVPLTIPSSLGLTSSPKGGRARGFSAPGSYQPMPQAGATGQWGNTYNRALPPLTVPSDPPLSHGGMYPSSHALHPVSSADDHGSFNSIHYQQPNREVIASAYPYPEQNNWSFSPISSGSSSSHSGSLTSLLNPPSNGSSYPPTRPTINTSYPSSLSSVSMQHSASSLSPDSRPATGYSVSSMSSLPYDDNHHYSNDYPRPGSGHHRPITPTSSRPPSSKSSYAQSTLSVRRQRRHSQAVNPYPTPYEQHLDNRPSSSPQPGNGEDHGLHRSRSMIQLPTVDTYSHYGSNQHQPDFAYSAGPLGNVGTGGAPTSLDQTMDDWNSRSVRPSTSASSLSAASQTSSSQAHTPPVTDHFEDTGIHRFSPDFGYVAMNEHITQYDGKAENVYGAETGSV